MGVIEEQRETIGEQTRTIARQEKVIEEMREKVYEERLLETLMNNDRQEEIRQIRAEH